MLKIKDFVDLKELEKFGFRLEKVDVLESIRYLKFIEEYQYIVINDNKEIYIVNEYVGDNDYIDTYTSELDVLYDLITSGIVEKVKELD